MNYAFTHATLLTGQKDMASQGDMTVVIREGRISDIKKLFPAPEGCTEINLAGRFLMPGLINLGSFLPSSGKAGSAGNADSAGRASGASGKADRNYFLKIYTELLSRNNAKNECYSGVTSLFSAGEAAGADITVRNEIANEKSVGPRILACGPCLLPPGGASTGLYGISCGTEEECRAAVAENARAGADWIRIHTADFAAGSCYTGPSPVHTGVSETGKDEFVRMPPELLKAACTMSHKLGLKAAVRVMTKEDTENALQAGADLIENVPELDDGLIGCFKENGTALSFSFSALLAFFKLPQNITGLADSCREKIKNQIEGMSRAVGSAMENGIPVGISGDSGRPYAAHYGFFRELCNFSQLCGARNEDVLYAATAGNAKILGIDAETGKVECGKCADLIVTNGNPVDDLKALRQVTMVMAAGNLIRTPHVRHLDDLDDALDEYL
ncbi:MAG TPA: amidohydrolase family protein [Lachnospiraceae bacterium]|nr:amidohydrolase family protein [Lachnospiraceae bacterium]